MREKYLEATFQNSYYKKAKILEFDNVIALQSYRTIVCSFDKRFNIFDKHWWGYSRTTMRHINDFRKFLGLKTISKKEWDSFRVMEFHTVGI